MKKNMCTSPRLMVFVLACAALPAQGALRFDGANDYVTFGVAPGLGVTNFTIECWFKRQGAGAATSTGTGGINVIPLVTKGRGENEAGVTNMNYFLGLGTNNLLAADFEDKNDGLNHPATNTTASVSNNWQHAAVTYQQNGTNGTWVTYLNGAPIKTNTFNGTTNSVTTPQGNSIQHAALGSALTTVGTADGFFNGSMDEVRIWNSARNANQIATNMNRRIVSAANLIGRWPLTETSGTTASDTSGSGITGSLINGPVWTADSPFTAQLIVGNTNDGTATDGLWGAESFINASRFQATSNMVLTAVHAKVAAIAGRYKCAIYTDSNSLPQQLLGSTAEISNPANGWHAFSLSSSVTLTNGQFCWLAIWSDNSGAQVYYSDTVGTLRWGQYDYGAWPNLIIATTGNTLKYCIYASGGPPSTLTSITVSPANPTVSIGNNQQFSATGNYSDGSAQNLTSQVTWGSSNAPVATINGSGLATAVSVGTATIHATLGSIKGTTLMTVQIPPLTVTTTSLPGGATNVPYSASLTASGGTAPYTWQLASGALPTGLTLNTNTGAISGTPTAAGVSSFTARVRDNVAATNTSGQLSISIFSSLPPGTNLLFNFTNVWRYRQLTNLDGTNWKLPGYNDSAWPSGPGLLAYETCGCLPQPTGTTLVTNEGSFTYYFRTHFNFAGNPANVSLLFSNVIDDGAVFYLNGVEIARANMPAGTVTYTTLASTTVDNATNYTVLDISGDELTNLVAGDNVLAVEVHQINSTSTDIVFGSSLSAVSAGSPPLRVTTASLPGGVTNLPYSATLTATGGTTPYTWSLASGSLPTGLTLNPGSGVISGTPTTISNFSFTARVQDNIGLSATSAVLNIAVSLQQVHYVIVISVDGMGSAYIPPLLTTGIPNELTTFKRFQAEGSGTLNARNDVDYAVTLPNHVAMMTGRATLGASGHGWTLNDYPDGAATTLELKKGTYVASAFDVAHDNGLRTGIWASKSKFNLFQQSFSATSGALDTTSPDNGRDKIDYDKVVEGITPTALTDDFINQMTASPFNFVFFHYAEPDTAGHSSGWSTDPASAYATALKDVDTQIGRIIQMVENSPTLQGKTAIILTTDHGGHGNTHGDTANPLDYTIPFYVWGPGVTVGGDLYAMNPASRTAPGTSHPPYTGGQPVRNGDSGNLALSMLYLGPVPGSTIDSARDLQINGVPAGTNQVFDFANVWRYRQLVNLDATNWESPAYDDSSWPSGPGVLAYETCSCLPQPTGTTLVTNEGSFTYYFRTHFNFAGNPANVSLLFSNLIDDGAVFYLNGVEIARANMPAGTVTYTTLASTTVDNATNYTVLDISGDELTNLVVGDNVLAVEVHQINATSSDIVFGSALSTVTGGALPVSGGLFFDGVNDRVTFGEAPSLGVTNFTLECWFKTQGAGKRANTGTLGLYGYPLVTKGQGENEAGRTNMNYFFGIGTNDSGQAVLAADFEDIDSGLNHPVRGVGPVTNGEWQHGAVTYERNGTNGTWRLYLNGVLDRTLAFSGDDILVTTPQGDSLQHAALGGTLRTGGTTNADTGFFAGTMDEARVWNYARNAQQIATNYNRQIKTSEPGLIARWSLDDASGTVATNSISGGVNGTLVNGPVWTDGYPFPPGSVDQPPAAPVPNAPSNGATNVSTSPTLSVTVSDPETNYVTVTFYGRVASAGPVGEDFTLVALPDTQFYSQIYSNIFRAQTDWIVSNRVALNIAYVAHLGDIVNDGENGGNDVQWRNATNAMYRLEDAVKTGLPTGIPYGFVVGNHDQTPNGSATGTTTFYNQYFGLNRFSARPYYGGHYGTNNDNHYDLFSAGGMDFIAIYFEYDPTMTTSSPVLAWANGVLAANQNRRAIAVSHNITDAGFDAAFSAQGQAIYDGLKGNTNLFLMLCGHVSGEGQRTNVFNGCTVWSVLSDYQGRTSGGSGWMRLYEFSPANSVIHVKTYSPWLDQWETDADSQFDIPYAMSPANPFTAIAINSGVTSGATTSITWSELATNTVYEWYVTVNDGTTTTTGPVWQFTTGTRNAPPVANSQSLTNAEDAQLAITLSGYDPEGSNITYTVVSGPTHGSFSGTAPNLLFTPTTNYHGADSLAFVVDDGALTSAVATVSLTITPVNDAPIASNATVQVTGGAATGIVLPATDPDGDALTFSLGGLPTHGLVSNFNPANGTATYTPARGYGGSDSVSFTATDGLLTSGAGVVTLAVQPLVDANGNGMPDVWEFTYVVWDPNADPDGDGMSNAQESWANTNPTNAASVLRINSTVMAGNGHPTFSWQAVGGTRYRVEYSDNLGSSFNPIVRSVANEMNPASLGVPTTQSFTDDFTLTGGPPANGARFYRIVVVQ